MIIFLFFKRFLLSYFCYALFMDILIFVFIIPTAQPILQYKNYFVQRNENLLTVFAIFFYICKFLGNFPLYWKLASLDPSPSRRLFISSYIKISVKFSHKKTLTNFHNFFRDHWTLPPMFNVYRGGFMWSPNKIRESAFISYNDYFFDDLISLFSINHHCIGLNKNNFLFTQNDSLIPVKLII